MNASPTTRLLKRLRDGMESFTESERLLANVILTDRQGIPFETAASLAGKLDISAVTVGRFARRLGYRNFRELKGDLKFDIAAMPWPQGEDFEELVAGEIGVTELQSDFDLTVASLREVYGLAATAEWDAVVGLLVDAPEVLVAGFQTERGIAEHFAHMLQYVRPAVRVVDQAAGSFADVLADPGPDRLLVVVETRRYSRQAQALVAKAAAAGMSVLVVTDKYCHWARKYTPHVLALPTQSAMFWDTLVPMTAALTLLANAVVLRLGTRAEPRLARITELYQEFTGHVGQGAPGKARAQRAPAAKKASRKRASGARAKK